MTETWRRACSDASNCLEILDQGAVVHLRHTTDPTTVITATRPELDALIADQLGRTGGRHILTGKGRAALNAYRAHRTEQKPRGGEGT